MDEGAKVQMRKGTITSEKEYKGTCKVRTRGKVKLRGASFMVIENAPVWYGTVWFLRYGMVPDLGGSSCR